MIRLLTALLFAVSAHASTSQEHWVAGLKYPNSPAEGTEPVRVWVRAPMPTPSLSPSPNSEKTLVPFVLAAPDQTEAGSCLYMSLTGAVEVLLAHLNPQMPRTADGPLDLSERWVMNASGDSRLTKGIRHWRVDSVQLFNNMKEIPPNSAYRFTKGWYTTDSNGSYVKSNANTKDAIYDTPYNWIDERDQAGPERVKLPTFTRQVLFEDPTDDSWDVGVAPIDLVDQIKTALRTTHSPVQVIYNHYGYWHAHLIVGYDDEAPTDGCSFVEGSRRYFNGERMTDSPEPPTQKELDRMAERKRLYAVTATKMNASLASRGACNPKGIFFVRDSIYVDEKQPDYVYDASGGVDGVAV